MSKRKLLSEGKIKKNGVNPPRIPRGPRPPPPAPQKPSSARMTLAECAVAAELSGLGEAYGLQIVRAAQADDNGDAVRVSSRRGDGPVINRASIYVLLQRLENKGFAASRYDAPTPGDKGPRRRVFWLTDLGSETMVARAAAESIMASVAAP